MEIALPLPVLMLVANIAEEEGFFAPRDRIIPIAQAAIEGGTNAILLRYQGQAHWGGVWAVVRPLKKVMPPEVMLITNAGDNILAWRTGVSYGAAGVHLPEKAETTPTIARQAAQEYVKSQEIIVGRSVHSIESAMRAKHDDTDYLIAGTIYESLSHPGKAGQGAGYLREVCEAVAPLPVIAIGGITPERVGECVAAGAAGVAVLSPIMRADDPRAVAARYREELDKAWNLRSTENQ